MRQKPPNRKNSTLKYQLLTKYKPLYFTTTIVLFFYGVRLPMNSKNISGIIQNPSTLNQPVCKLLSKEQLNMPKGDLLKILNPHVVRNYYNGFTLEFMYRFLSEHPKIQKMTIVNEKGRVSILVIKNHDFKKVTGECLGSCLAQVFKPYVKEAKAEMANSEFAGIINEETRRFLKTQD